MPEDLQEKYSGLLEHLKQYRRLAVAFSGGVDSTFLLSAAVMGLQKGQVLALTVDSPYIPDWEVEEAKQAARKMGVRHEVVSLAVPDQIRHNPEDRCYLCKTFIFNTLREVARRHGFEHLAEGTNRDDTRSHRPGMKALDELGIVSPLKTAGFTKEEIRRLSRQNGLETWDKPAYACLLTRLPYGTAVDESLLRKIEKAEFFLFEMGLRTVRVRVHGGGELARIEMKKEEFNRVLDKLLYEKINRRLKRIGFRFVTLDLEGFRSGSFDN